MPAAAVFGHDVVAGLVWAPTAPRLLGFFPARVRRWRNALPFPILQGWVHDDGPLGTPLVDYDHAEAAIAVWLDDLARNPRGPALAMLPLVPEEGAFAAALNRVTGRGHHHVARFGRHLRPQLLPGNDRESHLDRATGTNRRKKIARQRRRLQKSGAVIIETASFPTAIVEALGDFFVLEASGWKGRAGTAAAQPDIRRFREEAAAGLAANFQARVDRLLVGEHAVAAMVTLRSGAVSFGWKTAYDEAFARSSPGTQLLHEVTAVLLGDPTIARVDSCAAPEDTATGDLWRERLALSDCLILAKPRATLAFNIGCSAEILRRKVISGLLRLRVQRPRKIKPVRATVGE
jgi:hypothetical protein